LTSGYVYGINQQIEGYNIADFNYGTSYASPVTASFWFRSNMPAGSTSSFTFRNGLAGGVAWALYNTTFTVTGGGAWQYVTLTIPPPPSGSGWNSANAVGIEYLISSIYNTGSPLGWSTSAHVGFSGQTTWWTTTGNYVEATGVQLEKGSVATPFEVRPFGIELSLCQRYYVRFTGDGSFKPLGIATAINTVSATGIIVVPTSMRSQPTIIDISSSSNTCAYTSSMIQGTTTHTTNDVYLYSANLNLGFTTIGGTGNGVASLTRNLIGINLSNGSGLTAGGSGMLYMSVGKYIGFSAEL
jgi:hypothetical protein